MRIKVDLDNVEEKYRFMCKEDMDRHDIGKLGVVILKDKLANLKYKIRCVFTREKK